MDAVAPETSQHVSTPAKKLEGSIVAVEVPANPDTALIRTIILTVASAFVVILALTFLQQFVQERQVETARAFSALTKSSVGLGASSQRAALLIFASLNPRGEDLDERLNQDVERELSNIESQARKLRDRNQLLEEGLLGDANQQQLTALEENSLRFVESARSVRGALLSQTGNRQQVATFADETSRMLAQSRRTVDALSQDAILSAVNDRNLKSGLFSLNLLAIALTAALVLISLVRRLREELRLRRATEARLIGVNEELERFSAVVAHDLNGPLSNIALGTELMKGQIASHTDVSGIARSISGEIARLRSMIKALLRLSRVSTSRLELTTVALEELFRDIERSYGPQLEKCNGRIQYRGGHSVRADRALLQSLFQNLIENAVKYRREEVALEVEITSRTTRESIEVLVQDNGRGIERKWRTSVFEPFFQAHDRAGEGHGLGLSVVKKIAVAHGGQVEIVDGNEAGTCFCIRLPRSER